MGINDRIKLVRGTIGLTQTEFGEKIGFKQNTIGQMENGSRGITDRAILLICEKYNVSEDWLRNGTGEMFVQDVDMPLGEYARQRGADELEITLMKAYFDIDPKIRKALIDHLRTVFSRNTQETSEELGIDQKVESYRQELEAAKKAETSSASRTIGDDA